MTSTFRTVTQHSHAAPFIRERLAVTLTLREEANRQRDRRDFNSMASGLRQALNILMSSDDYHAEPGIAQADRLPPNALHLLRDYLGSEYERLIGEPPVAPHNEHTVNPERLHAVSETPEATA